MTATRWPLSPCGCVGAFRSSSRGDAFTSITWTGWSPSAIVKSFYVLEDRFGQLEAGVPSLPGEQFDLHAAQNDSTTALSYGSPTVPRNGSRPAERARWVKVQDVVNAARILTPLATVDLYSSVGPALA